MKALRAKLQELFRTKFVSDVIWTFTGRVASAASGIIVTILIGNVFSAAELGVYLQAVAFYMILSLFTVLGVNISVLRHAGEHRDDRSTLYEILGSALGLAAITAVTLTLMLFGVLYWFPGVLNNPPLVEAMKIIMLGLPLVSVSRIFISFLNGLRRMRLFSMVLPIRWGIVILGVLVCIYLKTGFYTLFYTFLVSDFILLLFLLIVNRAYLRYISGSFSRWWRKHLKFGMKTFVSGSINLMNRRIDVLMVGFLLNNEAAGLYGFASTAARGFVFIRNVIHNNFSPIVSKLWASKDVEQIRVYYEKIKKNLLIFVLPLLIVATLAYPVAVNLIMKKGMYSETWDLFIIIMAGVAVSVLFNWTDGMLSMADFLNETIILAAVGLGVNVVGNFIFIDWWGVNGAAIATTLAYLLRFLLIRYYIKDRMGIRII